MNKEINIKTLGADPEFILLNGTTGEAVSIEGMVGGDKHNPYIFDKENDKYNIHEDGMNLEYNIPPCESLEEWQAAHSKVQNYIRRTFPMFSLSTACETVYKSGFDTDQATEIHCGADKNIYSSPFAEEDRPTFEGGYRCVGGHIHIGYEEPSQETNRDIVALLDLFFSIPALKFEGKNKRRTLYGKAGSYRETSYGLEYRTPTNWWTFEDQTRAWVWETIHEILTTRSIDEIDSEDNLKIQLAINEQDEEAILYLTEKYSL